MAKGVRKHSQSGKWTAVLYYNGKNNHVGLYETEAQAEYHLIKEKKKLIQQGVTFGNRAENNYVDAIELYKEMVVSKAQGKLTRKMSEAIMLIAKNTIRKMRYKNEDDKYDCYSYGLFVMLQNWHNFDEDRYDNVLAYLTEIFKRGIAMHWSKIQKHSNHISIESTFENGSLNI